MSEIEAVSVRVPCCNGREQNLQRLRAETFDLAGIDQNVSTAVREQAFSKWRSGLETQNLIENDGVHFVFVLL
jgi:hypothetical protein